MTLRLILTRHAKSSWDDPLMSDHDRPLNERGKAAAADLGNWLASRGYVPDVVKEVSPSPVNSVAVVCGPPIMTKFTLPALVELGFTPETIFTSLEKRMKCGVGKCGRCNLGPKYICKDGPVFSLAELNALPADL